MPQLAVQTFLDAFEIRSGTMLVAVSGGLDSCVLLDVLRRLAPRHGLHLVVGHVDHQLRGEASEADARFVLDLAEKSDLPSALRRVLPEERRRNHSSRTRPTLEEAAREVRREALVSMADEVGADWIATAHHAGDQAETLLLRLLRGTGPAGLKGMAPMNPDGRLVRPVLDCLPDQILDYATAQGLDWRVDASNGDRAFSRNRLRVDWIPGLKAEFNPQLLRTLSKLAETQREEGEWIEGIVDEAAEHWILPPSGECRTGEVPGVGLLLDGWVEIPTALARRLVRRALIAVGLERDLTRQHIERVLDFLRRGRRAGRDKRVELPRGIILRRIGAQFFLGSSIEGDNATVRLREKNEQAG